MFEEGRVRLGGRDVGTEAASESCGVRASRICRLCRCSKGATAEGRAGSRSWEGKEGVPSEGLQKEHRRHDPDVSPERPVPDFQPTAVSHNRLVCFRATEFVVIVTAAIRNVPRGAGWPSQLSI